jgi:hypothetical protein
VSQYSIERLSADNLHKLQTLYKAVFHKTVSVDFLQKKYDTRFTGVQFIGYLALSPDKTAAAFYGVLPCYFSLQGRVFLAAQSGDTMTHPSHQRAGLFLQLAEKTYALATEKGIELIFGFPNQNSLPGFQKLKWTFLPSAMKRFTFDSYPSKIYAVTRIPFLLLSRNWILRKMYRDHTKISHVANDIHPDGLLRDDRFVEYKKYSNSMFIQIEGARAWLKSDGILKVGYVDVSGIASMPNFLRNLKQVALRSGSRHLLFLTMENTRLFKALAPFAMPQDSFPIGFLPLTPGGWNFSDVEFEYCDIDIF